MNLPDQTIIDRFAGIVGEENLLIQQGDVNPYQQNVTDLHITIAGVLKPANQAEVVSLVKAAAELGTPLYPISKGLNWGLGSRLPVKDGSFILDLGRLQRIIKVDVEQQYAVLEPGVTQKQLYDYLEQNHLPLTFNVTGSGVEASVLGNALDRGVGYRTVRTEDILSMEVVTGTGDVLKTGFGHYEGAKTTGLYPYGIGPDLNGLFFQSGMGVVTSAMVRLFPRKEKQMAVLCTLTDENRLDEFLDKVAWLRKQEVLTSVVHVGNRQRTKVTVMPLLESVLADKTDLTRESLREEAGKLYDTEMKSAWTALATLDGTSAQVRAAIEVIRDKMKGYGRITVVDKAGIASRKKLLKRLSFLSSFRKKSYLLEALEPLLGLPLGEPSDVAIQGVYWAVNEPVPAKMTPDSSRGGLKFILPTAPLSGEHGATVARLTEEVFAAHGFTPYITLNTITSRSFGCVINLAFDRGNEEETAKAHTCSEALLDTLIAHGYYPYRVNVAQMDKVVMPEDPFWKTIDDLKKQFDPASVIAPGKYTI